MKQRIVKVTVGLAAASLALAACSGQPGAAAVVGPDRISEASFANDVQAVLVAQGRPANTEDAKLTSKAMNMLVSESLVHQLAVQAGINITPGQIESTLQTFDAQAGGRAKVEEAFLLQSGVAPSQVNDAVRFSLEISELGKALDPQGSADAQRQAVGQAVVVLSEVLDVQVSPRYGTWDSKNVRLGAVPDDLSVPAQA